MGVQGLEYPLRRGGDIPLRFTSKTEEGKLAKPKERQTQILTENIHFESSFSVEVVP